MAIPAKLQPTAIPIIAPADNLPYYL